MTAATPPTTAPLAHTIPEAGRIIGVRRSSVYKLIASGQLDARRIGGRTVITYASICSCMAGAPDAKIAKAA
jgi:hypothetical protein